MEDLMIKIDNVSKQYRLGQIGGGTLQGDLQSWWAKRHGREDPNSKIGAKTYGKNETFLALDGVSFEVKKGERVGIIGHNGAGKSTLLKLLSRVTAPTSGEIGLNGRVASMLEVGTGFHGELTGRENIYMNGAILGMTRAEIDRKMEDIIEFSECRQFIDTPVKRYSSGMYVKLAFSVAAHLDSEIMIMDEVLAVGDMAFQKKCLDKMNDVSRTEGRTILYVSHNMNTIRQLCDRVVVLNHGKVVFDGDVERGIEVYMGKANNVSAQQNVFPEEAHFIQGNRTLSIDSLQLVSHSQAIFEKDSIAEILVVIKSFGEIEQVGFRWEITYYDSTPAGTAFFNQTFDFHNEERSIIVAFDTSHLAPGNYNCNLVAYQSDQYGNETYIDGINGTMKFEIQNSDENLFWKHNYWGHIRLHDSAIQEKL